MLRLICIVASVSIAAADFVPADEACGNDEEDCALSLRQLRGHQAEVEVSEHRAAPLAESPQVNELAEPIEVTPDTAPEEAEEDEYDEDLEEEIKINETARQNKREAEEGGTCCFSGENSKDTCGTCYPMSIASYKSKCSKKNNCMGCGGTWCQSTCVIGAADPLRKCQTAYPTGVSKDPVCSRDPIACHGCQGEWCRAGYNSHFVIEENSHGREVPEYMAPEDTDGICCYRGEQKNDTCGTCADIAKDTTCSVKSRCSGCGGTWCPAAGPKCVKAFKDPEDPCKSAEPMTGIAERWDFCALNEKHCTNCKGAWCLPGNITYYDGTKRLEEAGGHSWEESPASSDVNETDAVEASPASLGEEVHSKKTSSLLSDVKNCPLSSFYARRLYGFPPSVWFDSDEESEEDESLAKSGTTSSGADENATN